MDNRVGHCQTAIRSTGSKAGDCVYKSSRNRIIHSNVFNRHIARVLHLEGVGDFIAHGCVGHSVGRLCQSKPGILNRRDNHGIGISGHSVPVGILPRHCGRVHNFARVKVRLDNRVDHCQSVIRNTRRKAGDGVCRIAGYRIAHGNVVDRHIARVLNLESVGDLIAHGRIGSTVDRLCQGKSGSLNRRDSHYIGIGGHIVPVGTLTRRRCGVFNVTAIKIGLNNRVGHCQTIIRSTGSKAGDGARETSRKRIGNDNVFKDHIACVLQRKDVDDLITHSSVGRSVGHLRQGKPGSLNRRDSHYIGIIGHSVSVGILTRRRCGVFNVTAIKIGLNNRVGHCQSIIDGTRRKAGDAACRITGDRIAHGNVVDRHVARVLNLESVSDLIAHF